MPREGTKMQPEAPEGMPPKPVRILVVEDVVNLAAVLKVRLESYGYEICEVANTGLKAIDGALYHRPDLILMDIMLEGDMNGIEAAERILVQLDVPIIYLSCLNDEKVIDQAIGTNPYGYILKPYDGAELRFGIENALKMHRSNKQRNEQIAELEKRSADPTT
jgi:two-component system, response regulator PdtaR